MNKSVRKIAAVLCAMALLCCPALAAAVSAAGSATVTVGTVSAHAGDTVEVPLSISDVTAVGGLGFYLKYDGNVLECTGASAQGILNAMELHTANAKPVEHPNEIWVTGLALNGVTGDGVIATMTFKVKENAPQGVSAIQFTDKTQELYGISPDDVFSLTTVNGGVQVVSGDAPADNPPIPTDAPSATQAPVTQSPASPTEPPRTSPQGGGIVVTDASGQNVTRPDGGDVTLAPSQTLVDSNGAVETTPEGDQLLVNSVAVLLGSGTVQPGGTVTVPLSVTEVKQLAALSVRIRYDTEHMKFIGGQLKGFVAENMAMKDLVSDTQEVGDKIWITAVDSEGVSGEGVIAELQFQVYSDTPAGTYTIDFDEPSQLLLRQATEIPSEDIAGEITVAGEAVGSFYRDKGGMPGWGIALIAVGAVLLVAVVVLVVLGRKGILRLHKAPSRVLPPQKRAPQKSPAYSADISGEDDVQPPPDEISLGGTDGTVPHEDTPGGDESDTVG